MSTFAKKFRKLRRDPGKFIDDFIANRKRQFASLRRKPETSLVAGSVKSARRFSVVSAVYNVAPYLDEYFRSVIAQTLDFRSCIELVMVDDGSPDDSARIIRKWQRKYPDNIRYVRKENGGQASARNLGIEQATGSWITFIDPDDFVSPNYFEQVDKEIGAAKRPPAMVSCNFIFYFVQGKRISDTHPLKYRFAKGTQAVDFWKSTAHIQLSAPTAFFDAEVIARHGIRFDERIKPNFEDAHFVNSYLLHAEGRQSIFCQDAKYYYRKRSDGTSTLDTAWEKEGLYTDVLEHGVLALMRAWYERTGGVPSFVQRVALYHLIWYFKRLVNNDNQLAFLSDEQRARFVALLHEIFALIDTTTIDKFELAGIWFMQRVGMMAMFKGDRPKYQIVYVDGIDFDRRLIKLKYFVGAQGFESFRFDGAEVAPVFATSRSHTFVGAPFVQERIVWLPLRQYANLTVMLECEDVRLSLKGKQYKSLPVAEIRAHFEAARRNAPESRDLTVRLVCWLARLPAVQEKYRDAWTLMDRDVQADDNAEHLYRYLRKSRPEINAFFLLARSSHDWKRLKREGFRLVAFGGLRHKLLMLNCVHLVSSHIDRYVVNAVPVEVFGARLKHRLTFLQHGVIKDDLSDWLNTKEIDCFVTSAPREFDSIADAGTRYKFSAREVVLTGLPRHDRLVDANSQQKVLLVMPTWRKSLMGSTVPGTFRRELNRDFVESAYFKEWNGLLGSDALSDLARRHGYRIVFYPHANVQPYGRLFDLPDNVQLLAHADGSIQDVFRSAAVMITDYSSVAFEFGLMQRPVVYFQFDRSEVFGGGHIYQKGYFDYDADGFGPVCAERAEVLDAVSAVLAGGGRMSPDYHARAEAFLPLRDGRNCERTYEAIAALDRPAVASPLTAKQALEGLERAVAAQKWSVAVERAASIEAMSGLTSKERTQAALRGSQAWRELGDAHAARAVLDAADVRPQSSLAAAIEFAELASMLADWDEAAERWDQAVTLLSDPHGAGDANASVHARHQLIRALLHAKRDVDALTHAAQLLDFPLAYHFALPEFANMSRTAFEMNDSVLARRFALAVLDPMHPDVDAESIGIARATLASLAEQQGDAIKARGMWMRALRAAPLHEASAAAFDALADAQEEWSAAHWTSAREASSMFVDFLGDTHANESSHELDVALTLCAMHRALGEIDTANHILYIAQATYANDVFVHLEAAELALAAGDCVSAESEFAKAYATPCGSRLGRVARGLVIARQALGKLEGLDELASAVAANRPADLGAARAFASIASAECRWNEACDRWRKVLALVSPDEATPRNETSMKLAAALRASGQLDEAQSVLSAALEKAPGEITMMRALGELATEREDWTVAATIWSNVERMAGSSPERRHASRMLALALWWSGDEARARERLWREVEASAFTALAADDVALAARQMSGVALGLRGGASIHEAGETRSEDTVSRSSASVALLFDEHGDDRLPDAMPTAPRSGSAVVDVGSHP
ncbi:glycosyl transferase family 2 [Caballeronia temeraria]|uniref:Glycosyl transferase family 2 n=1 Tax=Caballeronia temeraria TaxID=1777137 RepID=A0A158CJ03_9BURK|nr:CDP-glycerol glycerophosphotransferase family protein [Caballeronia temeraria]SAK81497.1 glycosyl transferase family 2 [Caballeronia temeraria]